MEFYIVVNQNGFGYSASCPSLKGCHSQGDTEKEVIENIKSAIKEYLEVLC